MNSLMFSLASVVLLTLAIVRGNLRKLKSLARPGWLWLGVFTLTSSCAVLTLWTGVQKMDPSLAAFLNRAEVPVAIICGVVFLRERFTRLETIGALFAIAGIVVMRFTLRVDYMTGFWYVLAGSVLFGLAEFSSKIALRYLEPLTLVAVRNTAMCCIYWVAWYFAGIGFEGLEHVWVGVLALALLGPLGTRFAYVLALDRMPLSKLAVISQLQPVFVIIISYFAFRHLPTLREYVGGFLISSGVLILVLGRYGHLIKRTPLEWRRRA